MPTLSIPFSSVHSFNSISHSYHLKPNYPLTYYRSRRSFSSCAVRRRDDVDPFTQKSGYLFELSFSEVESLADYDISRITAIYRRKPFLLARRLFQIGNTFGKWFALRYVDRVMEQSDERFKVRAGELRKILVELGPAYIKIAQAVSSRADLIPPSYLDELTLLQDQIAPFSTEDAITLIEEELGLPVDMLFSEISPEPVAAASLGQVYKARLRQKGQVVAVKVQRPGVQAVISLDVLILHFLAGVLRRVQKLNTDLQAVVDEWASSLFREMDYRKEAENGRKFSQHKVQEFDSHLENPRATREMISWSGMLAREMGAMGHILFCRDTRKLYGTIPDVLVPEMYVQHTSRRVLVMQWVEGQKLSEVKDLYLVEVGVYCSFNQLLEHGFYHADPHPGNLLRTYDGKLAYLDFGMMGEFRPELRDGFIEACLHLVNRDFDALAKDFVTLGLLPPTADKEAVTNALIGVFQNAVAKGVRNISFGDLIGNLGTTMYQFKFRIPSYFSLVIRSLAVLEGIAVSSNPNYKVLGSTYPWIARKVLTDSSPKLKSSLQSLLYEEGVFRVDRLESLLTESLRARTENALVRKRENTISRVATNEILSYMLTDKGAFVRDILLQEFVKGLDALGLAILDSINSVAAANIPFGAAFSLSTMTDVDKMNLRNLHHFLLFLSRLQTNDSSTEEDGPQMNPKTDMEEVLVLVRHFLSVQEVLDILSLFPKLPPESQRQLLYLPADLSGRLISRVAAKTIRRIIL